MSRLNYYKIKRITDLYGNDRTDGRYPLRIGRRFSFGLGDPMLTCQMSICYRPYSNDDYKGTLRTTTVTKIDEINDEMIVKTFNSIYYFKKINE